MPEGAWAFQPTFAERTMRFTASNHVTATQ